MRSPKPSLAPFVLRLLAATAVGFHFTLSVAFAGDDLPALNADGSSIVVNIGDAEKVVNASEQPALQAPLVRAAYLVKPNVLALTVHAQAVIPPVIQPYTAQEGDKVTLGGYKLPLALADAAGVRPYVTPEAEAKGEVGLFRTVERGGRPLGSLLGEKKNFLFPYGQLVGAPLDDDWAAQTTSYSVVSTDDPAYAQPVQPTQIWRKKRPFRRAALPGNGGWPKGAYSHTYEIYLTLPSAIQSGKSYQIRFVNVQGNAGTQIAETALAFDDKTTATEAIQVNQHGYQTESPKVAFLSTWLGDGGEVNYSEVSQFNVLDEAGQVVLSGTPALRVTKDQVEFQQKAPGGVTRPISNSKTSVYALDFSALKATGTYRVQIPGLGVSLPFPVSGDRWQTALKVAMKGYYHQRASTALGAPYSTYPRPRNFHPEDGVKTYVCDDAAFYGEAESDQNKQTDIFKRIQRSIRLDQTVPNAIGGWHDAADFDRDIYNQRHLWPVNLMIDLVTINPTYFEKLSLNIPESGNGIPDILNEALWCTDLFLRLQRADGGVPSAVESIEHPRYGETSWLNSVPTAITPPSPESAYHFAGTSARLAVVLKKYNAEKAAAYGEAALKAIAWAEANPNVPLIYLKQPGQIEAVKNLAFAALFDLTGETKWEQAFAETVPQEIWRFTDNLGGLFVYATSSRAQNAELKARAKALIVQHANNMVDRQGATATFSLIEDDFARVTSHGFFSYAVGYAAALTGDSRYLNALARGAHFIMGANPSNLSFMKGIGARTVRPHHKDGPNRGLDIPDGIPVYGFATNRRVNNEFGMLITAAGVYPALEEWPGTESYFDDIAPNLNEYTVFELMAQAVFGYGILASQSAR